MKKLATWKREVRHLRRLEIFVDLVFALVFVLLATELPLPSDVNWSGTLTDFLSTQAISLVAIAIGLIVIVLYWIQNNILLGKLERTDNFHASVSILQVFFVIIYIYAIRLGLEFEENASVLALQSVTAALVGFAALLSWFYASQKGHLLSTEVSQKEIRDLQLNILTEPITALFTLPFSLLGAGFWDASWLLYFLIAWFLKRWQLPNGSKT